jgi:type VI secretion system protein ImpG
VSEELLPYYNRELSALRRLGAEFAEAHPKIASRLRLGEHSSEDPHVERLIEAVAFLTARIRHKLDDDFPEITDAILGALYPHYLAPVPSMAIVQLDLGAGQAEMTGGYLVEAGSGLETEPVQGEPCRFRTCYPTMLWPIEVTQAGLYPPPFPAPETPASASATAVLRLVLRCRSDAVSFASLPLGSLRFFLRGEAQHVCPLYELILNNTLEVALASSPRQPTPVLLPRTCLSAVGFERDEGMLPYTARSFLGYRLLTEFFAFPEKFHFFDLSGLDARALGRIEGPQLEVYLFLNRSLADLEKNVDADTFQLGCTPVVNLFQQRAEPVQLSHTGWEYRVVPDARRPLATEVYSVDRVSAVSPDSEEVEYLPFFSTRHVADRTAGQRYWHATRRAEEAEGRGDRGTEVYLSLVDQDFSPSSASGWTLDIETTCLNRDLPHRLPFGGDQPRLQLSEGGLVSTIRCLTPPTATLRPARRHGALWRLVSHLTLNHLSIVDRGEGIDPLREILRLYDYVGSPETRALIEGVLRVDSRLVVGRLRGRGAAGVCRGLEISVHLDEERFSGSGVFLFASVLERFLALYASINSFTQMVATVQGREGILRRWPPRAGEKVLL